MDQEQSRRVEEAADFAAAWFRLRPMLSGLMVPDRRTGQMVPAREVRFVLRRTTGQWLAQVGKFNATGQTEAIALMTLADLVERGQ